MSEYNRTTRSRRVPRMPREGSNRAQLRTALVRGDYDELPSRMPSRINRRDRQS